MAQPATYNTASGYAHIPASAFQQPAYSYYPAQAAYPMPEVPEQPTVGTPNVQAMVEEDQHLDRLFAQLIRQTANSAAGRNMDIYTRAAGLVLYAFGEEGQAFEALMEWKAQLDQPAQQPAPRRQTGGRIYREPDVRYERGVPVSWTSPAGYPPGHAQPSFQQAPFPVSGLEQESDTADGFWQPAGSGFQIPMVGVR